MQHFLYITLLTIGLFPKVGNDSGDDPCTLFSIGRSINANRIVYDVQLTPEGKLNPDEPIKIYWIKYTEGGKHEKLSFWQRKLGYGLRYEEIADDNAVFRFVSYSERTLYLNRMEDGSYRVFIESEGKKVAIEDIFINIDGGSFFLPKIEWVELRGKDSSSGLSTVEMIKP